MISEKSAPHKAQEAGQTRRDVRRLLNALFAPGDLVEIRVFETWIEPGTSRKRSKIVDERYHRAGKTLESLIRDMQTLNREQAGNVCFGVCPRPREGARKKADIEISHCLWADLDDCSVKPALKRVKKAGLPLPTIVIDSGHGIHLYWLLDRPIDLKSNLAQFEATMKAIAGAIGGDHVQNVDRLLRLPGFDNVKNVRNGAKPVPCEIVSIHPARRYRLAVFEAWRLKRMKSKCIVPPVPAGDTDMTLVSVDDPALKGEIERRLKKLAEKPVGKRSEPDFGFLSFLKSKGVKKEAAWDIVKGTGKFQEKGRQYFDRTWKNAKSRPAPQCGYFADPTGTFQKRETEKGVIDVRLANFSATIVADIVLDDGGERRREFEIMARVNGNEVQCQIPADEFADMKWVPVALGPAAIVESGYGKRDHLRAAIQHMSTDIERRRVYTHTGWRKHNGEMVYLHAGGAIGAEGVVPGVVVNLEGPLKNFKLPEPPEGEKRRQAIRAFLRMRKAAPGALGFCVLAAVCRAPIDETDFSIHLSGPTGNGKTECAALAQQSFGKLMDARHLPASWSSTANANEILAYLIKDSLLTIDDFSPTGSPQEIQRQHREADRLFRGKGNAAGRARLRPDASSRPTKPPRALILSTGEDIPAGESLRSRVWLMDVEKDSVRWAVMTLCQADAAAGKYAQAMAAFIKWLAPRRPGVCAALREFRKKRFAKHAGGDRHKRTSGIEFDLLFAFNLFLRFARCAGAITEERVDELTEDFEKIIDKMGAAQAEPRRQSAPAVRFLNLLNQAFVSGKAHLVGVGQITPPLAWGWEGGKDSRGPAFVPRGQMIGWYVSKHIGKAENAEIFLLPAAAHAVVADLAQKSNDPFTVSPRALHKRLREAGCLASTDRNRDRILVRRSHGGLQQQVLHMKLKAFGRRSKQETAR